jgi:hypothetical protein
MSSDTGTQSACRKLWSLPSEGLHGSYPRPGHNFLFADSPPGTQKSLHIGGFFCDSVYYAWLVAIDEARYALLSENCRRFLCTSNATPGSPAASNIRLSGSGTVLAVGATFT